MKNSIFAAFTLFVMAVNFVAPSLADTKRRLVGPAAQLVALLPASDAVITADARRLLNDALPRLLSGNQALLGKMTAKIEELQSKSGIDLRQFDTVAAGLTIRKTGPKNYDMDPVVIARGQVNSSAVIAAAKTATKGKFREEKVGTRTLLLFTPAEVAKQAASTDPNAAAALNKANGKLPKEMAATAYDPNTVVVGTPARVREMLAAKTRVSPELVGYLGRTDGAIIDFAANVPNGMSTFMPLDNDELGRNIDAIRVLYGSMLMSGDTTILNATAKTLQAEQAKGLKETLDGLQMLGKAFLGGSKSADKQVYARLIENARITQTSNEVNFALSVAQSDIDVLVGSIK